jgi:hypothetical protein
MADEIRIPQHADMVRIVRTLNGRRDSFFGIVIAVAVQLPENLGTQGEPTITAAVLDPLATNKAKLGNVDWYLALTRITGLRHLSHADVQSGRESIAYVEVIPNDGGPIHLQGLNMDDLSKPAAEAAEPESTVGTIVYINHNNGLEVFHGGDNMFRVHFDGEDHDFTNLFSAQVFVDAQAPSVGQNMAPLTPKGTDISQADSMDKRIALDKDRMSDPARLEAAKDKLAERVPSVGADSVPLSTVDNHHEKEELTPEPRGKSLSEIAEEMREKAYMGNNSQFKLDQDKSLRVASQDQIDKLKLDNVPSGHPEELNQAAIDAQNDHDRSTGNVDDFGRTPAESVEREKQV